MTDPPRYVVASPADATAVLRRLTGSGWLTRAGFALAETAWDIGQAKLVLFGRVSDRETARLAALAAARRAGVVAVADPSGEIGRSLIGDLSRLGPVHRGPNGAPQALTSPTAARLIPEQRALLERIANGETIAAAAAAEFLSLRTANRRIAHARELLGVRTTPEAVVAYLRQRRAR